ncbi:hypothetical protein [Rhizobium paknamense]|uniref:Lipoprotein n=1 Tax=Rhizobium paknamense TaxID=1206817 RepID=A0ABU0IG77_9HYPH|nr:hypothetical protein [Rhizobium paknamense]MDQ0457244.1 hypothetical protein [Rhizobium paknamense]
MTSKTKAKGRIAPALLLATTAVLAGCTTQKAELPPLEQGAIGDADAVAANTPAAKPASGLKQPYRDPYVSAAPKTAQQKPAKPVVLPAEVAENLAANVQSDAAPVSTPHAAAPTEADAANSSIVPQNMPTRRFQATVASVFSVQSPPAQPVQTQNPQMRPETAMVPAQQPVQQPMRAPTKAEIQAGLAPDPHKARQAVRPKQQAVLQQYQQGQPMSEGVPAQLQATMPAAMKAQANSGGVSQMEQIEGDPKQQSMTKDGFLKKFLAKFRKN